MRLARPGAERRLLSEPEGTFTAFLPAKTFVYEADIVNTMGTISARLPEDIEAQLERYLEEEQLDRSTAVRKLLADGLAEWRMERALGQLDRGEVTFLRAAELAGVSPWDLATLARKRDVTWVGGDQLADDLESL